MDGGTALAIFQGPHSYISSSWYSHMNVPTWNYTAVHAYGSIRLQSPDELQQSLAQLLAQHETGRPNAQLWDTYPADFLEREMKGIVGFQLDVTELQAAFKLSQNRTLTDHQNIIAALDASGDPEQQAVANLMRQHSPQSGKHNEKQSDKR